MSFSWGGLSHIQCSSCCPGPVCNILKQVKSSVHNYPSIRMDIVSIRRKKKRSVLHHHVTSFKILLENFHIISWSWIKTKWKKASKDTALNRLFIRLQLNWHVSHWAPYNVDSLTAHVEISFSSGHFMLSVVLKRFRNSPCLKLSLKFSLIELSKQTTVPWLCLVSFSFG